VRQTRGTGPRARALRLRQDAQQVATGHAGEICIAPAATCELLQQRREAIGPFEASGSFRDAIEVRAEAHVISARHLADVLDVIGDVVEGDRRPRVGGRSMRGSSGCAASATAAAADNSSSSDAAPSAAPARAPP
jgi:hypothetical protein